MSSISLIWILAFTTIFSGLIWAWFEYRRAWRAYANGERSALETMPSVPRA